MKKLDKKLLLNCNVYTLSEIASVAIMVGAVMALAIPHFFTVGEKTRSAEGVQIASAVWQANQLYILENGGRIAPNTTSLQVDLPTGGDFTDPPTLNPPPAGNYIVMVERTTSDYRIYMNDAGDLTCDDDGFPGARANICRKMGYIAHD